MRLDHVSVLVMALAEKFVLIHAFTVIHVTERDLNLQFSTK